MEMREKERMSEKYQNEIQNDNESYWISECVIIHTHTMRDSNK